MTEQALTRALEIKREIQALNKAIMWMESGCLFSSGLTIANNDMYHYKWVTRVHDCLKDSPPIVIMREELHKLNTELIEL